MLAALHRPRRSACPEPQVATAAANHLDPVRAWIWLSRSIARLIPVRTPTWPQYRTKRPRSCGAVRFVTPPERHAVADKDSVSSALESNRQSQANRQDAKSEYPTTIFHTAREGDGVARARRCPALPGAGDHAPTAGGKRSSRRAGPSRH